MGKQIKVLASDFDNTLFFRNVKDGYKECDITAIKEFQSKGNLFGICSGRPFVGLLNPLKDIIQPDFYIVGTGSAILDKDFNLLYENKLPFELALEIYSKYQDEIVLLPQTLSREHIYLTEVDENDNHATLINSLDDLRGHDLYGISLIKSTVTRATEITREINEMYDEVEAFQNIDSIDVVAKGCSKGAAIKILKDLLNIDEISGIGDSFNDISMFRSVDQGFTFKDSPIEVQNEANQLVSGIAEAISILEK